VRRAGDEGTTVPGLSRSAGESVAAGPCSGLVSTARSLPIFSGWTSTTTTSQRPLGGRTIDVPPLVSHR
jgi:hypothetical protein